MAISLPERLAGAVWGHLVGDAVGVPYEFRSPDRIGLVEFKGGGAHAQPPGTWSDDGALMLALLDSLLREPTEGEARFDTEDQGRRFLAWADAGRYTPDGDGRFDIGGATRKALDRLRSGVPAEQAGGTDEHSNGNGSLMRILPLALVERDVTDAVLVEHAQRSSAVTHGHPIAQAACGLYCLLVRRLLAGGERAAALADARSTLRALYVQSPDRTAVLDAIEAWSGRSGRGYVVDSFWSAWDAFASSNSYRETIERSIGYGHDTDTTACIAGGLAGAHWGIDAIPADWIAGMRGRAVVAPLVDRLIETDGWRTSSGRPIRVDWVDLGEAPRFAGWRGRLGMTFLPGKQRDGWTGQHWRDLTADAERLRAHGRADALLLLVEDGELVAARVPTLPDLVRAAGIELIRFPIVDQEAPGDRSGFRAVLDTVLGRLGDGGTVVVACRGGLGRTGTAVACLLRDGGLDARMAIALTRAARHDTIESSAQETFVDGWEWPDRVSQPGTGTRHDGPHEAATALASRCRGPRGPP